METFTVAVYTHFPINFLVYIYIEIFVCLLLRGFYRLLVLFFFRNLCYELSQYTSFYYHILFDSIQMQTQ